MDFKYQLDNLTAIQYILLSLNLLAIIFSKFIFKKFFEREKDKYQRPIVNLNTFRGLNFILLLGYLGIHFIAPMQENEMFEKLFGSILVLYGSYFSFHGIGFLIESRFAKFRENPEGKRKVIETYNSRLLKLISAIFIFIVACISLIQIFGFTGLLEASGVLGFIGVFLALTQSSWAPDIISGLVILNSGLIHEGDVIELNLDGKSTICTIFRIKGFHTELLHHVNNHRLMIKNSKLRDLTIQSLSRFASAKGLRERLSFNISYETEPAKIEDFFNKIFEEIKEDESFDVSKSHPHELRVTKTGDYAVEWTVFYYIKDTSNLLRTRHLLNQKVLEGSLVSNIDLSTPALLNMNASKGLSKSIS